MRIAMVCDEDGAWYVRRIRVVEHDLDRDEKVYRCDLPIGSRFSTAQAALRAAKQAIADAGAGQAPGREDGK